MAVIGKLIANFCALFLAINIIGHLTAYLSISAQMQPKQVRKTLLNSVYFIFSVSIGFMLLFWLIFSFIGIRGIDIQIAGGVLLFVLSIYALLGRQEETFIAKSSAIFPAFAQLIINPVFLIMLMVSSSLNGFMITTLALLANLIVVLYFLINSSKIIDLIEAGGVKIISRIVNILLCAFGVMLIRGAIAAFKG